MPRNSDEFGFQIESLRAGWANLVLTAGKQRVAIVCADGVDSLGDIVRGLYTIARDGGKMLIECDSEGGVGPKDTQISLRHVGERIEVRAKRCDMNIGPDWDPKPSGHAKAVFRFRGPFRQTVREIVTEFTSILERVGGQQGYLREWNHAFPAEEFKALAELVGDNSPTD